MIDHKQEKESRVPKSISTLKKTILRSSFAKNVLTLVAGTSIAQLIPALASPLLSRMYSPNDWGIFGLFTAIISILSVLSTGRYDSVILLPKNNKSGANLVALSIFLAFFISTILFFCSFFVAQPIAAFFNHKEFAQWLKWVPLAVFLLGTYSSLSLWLNRNSQYKDMSLNRIMRAVVPTFLTLAFGLFNTAAGGLILGTLIGHFLTTVAFFIRILRQSAEMLKQIHPYKMIALAKRYKNAPKFSIAADMINALTAQLPIFMFTSFFDSATAGQLSLAQRILAAPAVLISAAFGDVFIQRASQDYISYGNCRRVWLKTFKMLAYASFLPCATIGLFGPSLFAIIFGAQWRVAGEYSQLMALYIFLGLIASPLGRLLYIAERQREEFVWQTILLVIAGAGMYIGCLANNSKIAIALFSAVYGVMYVIYIGLSFYYSGHKNR